MSAAQSPLWTSEEAARATGGTVTRAWSAQGVSIDTRTLSNGDLFVALSGGNRDGHAFVAGALAKGAAAALVSDRKSTRLNSSHVSESRMPSSA